MVGKVVEGGTKKKNLPRLVRQVDVLNEMSPGS